MNETEWKERSSVFNCQGESQTPASQAYFKRISEVGPFYVPTKGADYLNFVCVEYIEFVRL